jgi:hypothetical protein
MMEAFFGTLSTKPSPACQANDLSMLPQFRRHGRLAFANLIREWREEAQQENPATSG